MKPAVKKKVNFKFLIIRKKKKQIILCMKMSKRLC